MKNQKLTAALTSLLLILSTLVPASAPRVAAQVGTPPAPQQQPPPWEAATESEDEVVRITTNLVQVDAVVVDEKGRRVNDLGPDDFELVVGDRPQQITNFSYISDGPTAAAPSGTVAERPADPARPALRPRPGKMRRTVAVVVDNLCTTFEDTHFARESLRKFVREQLQPDDMVAILQTRGGTGALQQFTSDRRLIEAAIESVRWNNSASRVRLCMEDVTNPVAGGPLALAPLPGERTSGLEQKVAGDIAGAGYDIFAHGTLGALNFILKGMKELPGRKSLVLLTDNLPPLNVPRDGGRMRSHYQRLADLANRASTVIYTIDLRGLPTLGLTAADDVARMRPAQVREMLNARRHFVQDARIGMEFLAEATGGLFTRNTNDINGGIRRAIDDQGGYYLIGFRPDENFFDPKDGRARFNTFRLKARRPGLKVRTRGGFYGFTDKDVRPSQPTRVDQLVGALTSPFAGGDVPVGLTSMFTAESDKRSFVGSLMHIDLKGLKYSEEPDGWRKATFDVIAVLFDSEGAVVEQVDRTETMRAKGQTFERLMRDGLVYVMQVPVKKPGFYQLRVAVRDSVTGKLGTASQLVEVPDLDSGRVSLSGIVLRGRAAAAASAGAPGTLKAGAGQEASDAEGPSGGPAVRRFRPGSEVEYYFNIYNAKLDRATGRPRIQTQMRLLRDGKPFYTGKVMPLDAGAQADPKNLSFGSRFTLGGEFPPGEYVLQVFITDELAKEKRGTATQWIDFEIVR